jgi:hypothetical protein
MPSQNDYLDVGGGDERLHIHGFVDNKEVNETAATEEGMKNILKAYGFSDQLLDSVDWGFVRDGEDLSFQYIDGYWTKWKGYREELGWTAWGRVEECSCQHKIDQQLEAVEKVLAGEPDVNTDLKSPQEVDAAAADLEGGLTRATTDDYWEKVRETLLKKSENKDDYDEAKMEWDFIESWEDYPGRCQLCGFHPIRYHFLIKNRLNKNELVIGSECVQNYLKLKEMGETEIRWMLKRLKNISKQKWNEQPKILDAESRVQTKFGHIRRSALDVKTVTLPTALRIMGSAAMKLARFGLRLIKELESYLVALKTAAANMRDRFKTLDFADAANDVVRNEPDPLKAEKSLDVISDAMQTSNRYGDLGTLQGRVNSSVETSLKSVPNKIKDRAAEIRKEIEDKLNKAEDIASSYPRVISQIAHVRSAVSLAMDKLVQKLITSVAQGQPAEMPSYPTMLEKMKEDDARWLTFFTDAFLDPKGIPYPEVRQILGIESEAQGPDLTATARRIVWMQAFNEGVYDRAVMPSTDLGKGRMREIVFELVPIYGDFEMGPEQSDVPVEEQSVNDLLKRLAGEISSKFPKA